MNLKIPPALQVVLFATLMWIITKFTNVKHFQFDYQIEVSWMIFWVGVLIGIVAVYNFRKANTTVDPLKPDKATKLIVVGIYKFTRNPMYLGMLFILLAFSLRLGNFYTLAVLVLYIWYITTFQIKPEEEALTKIFGMIYKDYCKKVRRWI